MKTIIRFIAAASFFICAGLAGATSYSFSSYDGSGTKNDIYDLDHYYIYLWSIYSNVPANESVISATISVKNIYNWDTNYNILKFYLLDNPKLNDLANKVDIIKITDNQSQTTANEIGTYQGTKFSAYTDLWTWSDTDGSRTKDNLTYSFDAAEISALNSYLLSNNPYTKNGSPINATFGLGFDPDCHFYNEGITLTIETAPASVPEPGTMMLFGFGLLALAVYGKRRMNKEA